MYPFSLIFQRSSHRFRLSPSLFSHHLQKHLSSSSSSCPPPPPIQIDLSHPIYMVWGSNTGVGKTLVSAGLASSVLLSPPSPNPTKFNYIKPVQTGFPQDSDSLFVFRKVSEIFHRRDPSATLLASNHALWASAPAAEKVPGCATGEESLRNLCWYEERQVGVVEEVRPLELVCKTVYAWEEAISPHLAAEREGARVEDSVLLEVLQRCLRSHEGGEDCCPEGHIWTVVETAGGVASPGPSGTLQCDLYRHFRLPSILVGDGRLGGISGTVSAYESLKLRGYDVEAIVLEDHGLSNEVALFSYLRNRVPVLVLPSIPHDPSDNLMQWFNDSQQVFSSLKDTMLDAHSDRLKRFHGMRKKAVDILWWPFTQHDLVPEETVTVIDSRYGENFAVHKVENNRTSGLISQQFDACASWWTQGPDVTMQIELARDMGYAAGRFGHVMFPENVYEPALHCAELLLDGVGRGWASRTYFSDNGSTAIEIALKMAFRKFSFDHGLLSDPFKGKSSERSIEFKVLALNGSYHGDTLGAMEAQAPSSYTGFLQQPWYSGRGIFLDPPTVFICNGDWVLSLPEVLQLNNLKPEEETFSSCDGLFHRSRDASQLAGSYSTYISKQLSLVSGSDNSDHIAALIIEPVIQGAGGMHFIDPLFQRVLVKECKSQKIPVIFDEVFTGFWRLGAESASELLDCSPDIACYAKLMTGGIIPLAATLATNAVFSAFKGDSKLMALLHGHSYTAHAMGCTAAVKAIKWFKDPQSNFNLNPEGRRLRELWDFKLIRQISSHPSVKRVVALGTLFAVELRAQGSDNGYASLYAGSLIQKLRGDDVYTRALGNVLYLMCCPCTSPHVCSQLLSTLYKGIDECSKDKHFPEQAGAQGSAGQKGSILC